MMGFGGYGLMGGFGGLGMGVGLLVWIGLIVASAVSLQVLLNWILSIGLGLYLLRRWQARRRSRVAMTSPGLYPIDASQPSRATRWR